MIARRCMSSAFGMCVLALLGGCSRSAGPGVPASAPASAPATQPTTSAPTTTQAAATQPVTTEPAPPTDPNHWVVCTPGSNQVPWLRITTVAEGKRRGCIEARLTKTGLLDLDTRDVDRLAFDMNRIPNRKPGRLILRIDNQAFEITGAHGTTIKLQRHPAGVWQIVR